MTSINLCKPIPDKFLPTLALKLCLLILSNLLKKNSQMGQKPLSIKEKIINQDNKQTTKENYWGKNKKGIDPEVNKENRKKWKKMFHALPFMHVLVLH